jgi:hypothetical protein
MSTAKFVPMMNHLNPTRCLTIHCRHSQVQVLRQSSQRIPMATTAGNPRCHGWANNRAYPPTIPDNAAKPKSRISAPWIRISTDAEVQLKHTNKSKCRR